MKYCINCEHYGENHSCSAPEAIVPHESPVLGVLESTPYFNCVGHRSKTIGNWWTRFTSGEDYISQLDLKYLCGTEGRWYKEKKNK